MSIEKSKLYPSKKNILSAIKTVVRAELPPLLQQKYNEGYHEGRKDIEKLRQEIGKAISLFNGAKNLGDIHEANLILQKAFNDSGKL